jgi:hypothetical protein
MFGLDKPRMMKDDELASGQGTRQWLIEHRLYGIQRTLWADCRLTQPVRRFAYSPIACPSLDMAYEVAAR